MQQFDDFKDHIFQEKVQSQVSRPKPPVAPPVNRPSNPGNNTRPEFPFDTPDINMNQAPLGAPPQVVPTRNTATRAVDSGSIRMCQRNFTYVWLSNGDAFWMYPIQVGRNSISGFRWNRRFGWVYFGIDLKRIDSFYCIPY